MVIENVTLTGALDDIRGLGLAVYQDHGAVRIDVGGIEIALDQPAARKLAELITIAHDDASDWAIDNAGDDE